MSSKASCPKPKEPSKKVEGKDEGEGYLDRVKKYFCYSNPLNLFASEEQINDSKIISLGKDKKKIEKLSEAEKAASKCLYESTHDPLTGEVKPFFARLSTQIPIKAITLGGMLAYYQTTSQIVFWQVLHNSLVSYINYKNKDPGTSDCEMALAGTASTAAAVGTALSLHNALKCSSPLMKRFIPLAAFTVGKLFSIAIIKSSFYKDGVTVYKEKGGPVGVSKTAGYHATMDALLSSILQVSPALVVGPLFLNYLEQKNKFCKTPYLEAVYAFSVTLQLLYILSPFVLAKYTEKASIPTQILEENIQKSAKNEKFLYYYNKL